MAGASEREPALRRLRREPDCHGGRPGPLWLGLDFPAARRAGTGEIFHAIFSLVRSYERRNRFCADPAGSSRWGGPHPGGAHLQHPLLPGKKQKKLSRGLGGGRHPLCRHRHRQAEFIAVSYKSGNDTGLALYGSDGGNWKGLWTYAGGREVGAEIWKRNSAASRAVNPPLTIKWANIAGGCG